MTQYHQVLTSTTQYWPSTTKHWPVPPIIDPVSSNQRESRFSRILEIFFEISLLDLDLEVSQFHFHFSKRVKQKIISLFISQKEWKDYFFHFSFLKKSECISNFTLFLEKKRVKLGPGYNITSIFVPNCISKDSQISSKYKPQNIGQISVLKSWPTPMLHVCTNLQHKKKLQEIQPWYLDQTSAFLPNCRLYVPHQ